MSKSQRTKGAAGERELAGILADALGIEVRRKLGQARDSGNDIDLPGFSVECKRRARIAGLYDWLEQADGGNGAPVVMARGDGKVWLAVMRLDDWLTLSREEVAAKMPANATESTQDGLTHAG